MENINNCEKAWRNFLESMTFEEQCELDLYDIFYAGWCSRVVDVGEVKKDFVTGETTHSK